MTPVCKHGSTAVLHCRFGSRPVRVVGTYWPVKNLTGPGSLWNKMLDESAEDNIDPIIQVKSYITSLCAEAQGEVVIVTGDFNTDVGREDVYNLAGTIQMAGLRHSSTSAELSVPSYHRTTLADTRLDYQLVGGPAEVRSCEIIDDYTGTTGHCPLIGRYKIALMASTKSTRRSTQQHCVT